MGLKDVTGFFSRYFIVGFFLPSYFALVAIYELAPGVYGHSLDGLKRGPALLVLGGAGLLLGLLLTGLADQDPLPPSALFAFYRGWRGATFVPRRLRRWLRYRVGKSDTSRRLLTMRPTALSKVAWRCDDEVFRRWGLVWRPVWLRVELLLSDVERGLHVEAETDVAFLVNSSLAAAVVAMVVFFDRVPPWGHLERWTTLSTWGWWHLAAAVIAGILARVLFVFAHRAAESVAALRVASIDVHRHELYERLGLPRPRTTTQELATAQTLNTLLHPVDLPVLTQISEGASTNTHARLFVDGTSFKRDYRVYVETEQGSPVGAKTSYVSDRRLRVEFNRRHVHAGRVRIRVFRSDPGGGSDFQVYPPEPEPSSTDQEAVVNEPESP
jgi:hypothetical protein